MSYSLGRWAASRRSAQELGSSEKLEEEEQTRHEVAQGGQYPP
jgi:hypothetical protein